MEINLKVNIKMIYYYINGNKYDGEWKNDKAEGKGIFYYNNGDKYNIEWKKVIKEGKVIYYFQKHKQTYIFKLFENFK